MTTRDQEFREKRERMVDLHIRDRGIADDKVLDAMRSVPRHEFVPKRLESEAYMDWPVPIGEGQTISQPYIVAYMINALGLKGGEKVLEIGAGCGYASAVLAEIAGKVFAVERIGKLAKLARKNLNKTGYTNVTVKHDDGTQGWADEAPFDAILVSAAAAKVPETLKTQLKVGGRLVIPVGSGRFGQDLVRITRTDKENFDREILTGVRFVPLVSDQQ